MNYLITLMSSEVKELQKRNKNKKLVKTCHHYYLATDDYEAMKIVAQMRGYNFDTFYKKCASGVIPV